MNFCPWEPATYFIFSENVAPLIYYSHIPGIIIALILGLVIFFNNKKSREAHILLLSIVGFSIWGLFDLVLWATNNMDAVMFLWSMQVLIEPLIFVGMLVFLKYVIDGKGWSFKTSLLISASLLPVMILLPTDLTLTGVREFDCVANEGFMAVEYVYILEILYTLAIVVFAFSRLKAQEITGKKFKEFLSISIGVILFLLPFLYGNIIGSISQQWEPAQFGLLGMPVFIGFLAYSMARFKSFNSKLFNSQVIIFGLWTLIFSLLFIQELSVIKIVVTITLIISIIFGTLLVKSVKREITQRQEIEKLAIDLRDANERLKVLDQQKSEFVSLASHQLRGPLTSIKGYISLIQEGDFGHISTEIKEALGKVTSSVNDLALLVGDYLDVSRIELGRMKYNFSTFALNDLVGEVIDEARPGIEKRGLELNLDIDVLPANINADRNKIKQVLQNFLDNAMKYTPEGTINVKVDRNKDSAHVAITDTGVGIPKEVIPHLFEKFSRAPKASTVNIQGTGLGLYVAKKIVDEHKGHVWVESAGEGSGSTFHLEIELV